MITPENNVSLFYFRFKDHGNDFCILVTERDPFLYTDGPGEVFPVDLILKNDVWGEGSMSGLEEIGNRTILSNYILAFPGQNV